MMHGQLPEDRLAVPGEVDEDLAAIPGVPSPSDQAAVDQAVDELDGAVVTELEPLGDLADGRDPARREPLHGEEQLVLLGLEPGRPRRLLAEVQEAADLVPELGERTVRRAGDALRGGDRTRARRHAPTLAQTAGACRSYRGAGTGKKTRPARDSSANQSANPFLITHSRRSLRHCTRYGSNAGRCSA